MGCGWLWKAPFIAYGNAFMSPRKPERNLGPELNTEKDFTNPGLDIMEVPRILPSRIRVLEHLGILQRISVRSLYYSQEEAEAKRRQVMS